MLGEIHFTECNFPIDTYPATQILESLLLHWEGLNAEILTFCLKQCRDLFFRECRVFLVYYLAIKCHINYAYSISMPVALTFLLLQYIFSKRRVTFGFSLVATALFIIMTLCRGERSFKKEFDFVTEGSFNADFSLLCD